MEGVSVWAVEHGNSEAGVTVAVFDNEASARALVASWDRMVLDHGADLLRVVRWSVQSKSMALEAESG